jgi:superfamily II DNA helicase RecQ
MVLILSVVHRPEYKQLHSLRDHLVGVPFVALTATATERHESFTISSLPVYPAFDIE